MVRICAGRLLSTSPMERSVAGKIEKNQKMPSNRRLIGSTRQQKTSSSQFAQQKGVFATAFATAGLDGGVFDLKKSCLKSGTRLTSKRSLTLKIDCKAVFSTP